MSAIARDPNIKHLIKARGQIAKGDLKNAALTLNQANARWPQDPRVFMLGGLMAEKAGHLQGRCVGAGLGPRSAGTGLAAGAPEPVSGSGGDRRKAGLARTREPAGV